MWGSTDVAKVIGSVACEADGQVDEGDWGDGGAGEGKGVAQMEERHLNSLMKRLVHQEVGQTTGKDEGVAMSVD